MADKLRPGLPPFAAVPFELIDDTAITDIHELAVYTALRRYADFTTGESCFPAIEIIAKKARCSERTAQEAIKSLEVAGWIAVDRTLGGRGHSNRYHIRLKKGCTVCTVSAERVQMVQERVQDATIKGAPVADYLDTLPDTLPESPPPPSGATEAPPAEHDVTAEEGERQLRELRKKLAGVATK